MTDVISNFYNNHPYPDISTFLGFSPTRKVDLAVPTDEDYTNKSICIAGCGTCQAFLVAQHLPKTRIVACDVAAKPIKITQDLLDKYDIKNVKLILSAFEDLSETGFDLILASGVMHHTANRKAFMNKAHDTMNFNGRFRGMVYHLDGRLGIKELSDYFIKNNFTVHDVRKYFESYPKHHMFLGQTKVDVEIADTWLNPRFHEYTVETLEEEFNQTQWKGCKRAFQVTPDNLKIYFEFRKSA